MPLRATEYLYQPTNHHVLQKLGLSVSDAAAVARVQAEMEQEKLARVDEHKAADDEAKEQEKDNAQPDKPTEASRRKKKKKGEQACARHSIPWQLTHNA